MRQGRIFVHLHVRNDDQTPTSNPERFAAVQAGIFPSATALA